MRAEITITTWTDRVMARNKIGELDQLERQRDAIRFEEIVKQFRISNGLEKVGA